MRTMRYQGKQSDGRDEGLSGRCDTYHNPFRYTYLDMCIDTGRKVIEDVRETAKDAELNRRLTSARNVSNLLTIVESARPIRRIG